ncbi:MAG: hypothetical protein IKD66_01365, partial [Solobacterium sp.]|nr:hypothetical protein [Solobacterium sp.]
KGITSSSEMQRYRKQRWEKRGRGTIVSYAGEGARMRNSQAKDMQGISAKIARNCRRRKERRSF